MHANTEQGATLPPLDWTGVSRHLHQDGALEGEAESSLLVQASLPQAPAVPVESSRRAWVLSPPDNQEHHFLQGGCQGLLVESQNFHHQPAATRPPTTI